MSKYFNEYKDRAAFEADTERKQLEDANVNLVGDDLIYQSGVNAEVEIPEMGDAVYHDAAKKVHFIKGDSLNKAKLPSDYVPVGVCGPQKGTNIYIVAGENASKRFAEFYRWKVSGWNLDGSAHTCKVTLHAKSCADFSYTASTLQQCADQLNTYLKTNSPAGFTYIAYMEGEDVMLQLCNYKAYQETTTISTLTVDAWTAQEIESSPRAATWCGAKVYPVWHLERAKIYFREDSTSTAYNPTSPVESVPAYPVCLPAYLGTSKNRDRDMCAWLRSRFGEGEEGWLNYLSQIRPIIPFPSGMMSDRYGTGKQNTYALAGQKVQNENGELTPLYPAADYAASMGFVGVKGLDKGDWFGHTPCEFAEVFGKITYGLPGVTTEDCDPINRTLAKMGFSTVSCNAASWLFSRSGSGSCWYAGSGGSVDGSYFCDAYRVVPLALYPLAPKDDLIN